MEHNKYEKSITGHGVRVYRRCVPTDTEVPPPVPKRTTSIARSQAMSSSWASSTRDHAVTTLQARDRVDALRARDRAAAVLQARERAAALQARDRAAAAFEASDRAAALQARDRTAAILQARDRAEALQARDRTAAILQARDRAEALQARDRAAAAREARDHAAAFQITDRAAETFPARQRATTAFSAISRPAAALPVVGRPAAALPAVYRPTAVLPAVRRPAAALPVVGRPAATLPVVGHPAAALPVIGRPPAALPAVRRPAAALPAVGRPAVVIPAVRRPAAPLPVVSRPAAALPVVGRPAAALPVVDLPVAALPDNDGEAGADGNAPRRRRGITGFMTSILYKTKTNISHGIEKSFRSLMSRRHHDSYRPAAVTDAFLQKAGLTGIASDDMADVDLADIELSRIGLSDPDIANIDPVLPMRDYELSMIMNGSVCPFNLYGDVPYLVKNSCPFDSVLVAVANAYMDYKQYAEFVDLADNAFLKLAKNLGMYGSSNYIYDKRLELLLPFFRFVVDTHCYTPSMLRMLDIECNVWKIVQDYFKRDPSSILIETCSNEEGCPGGLERIKYSASIVLNDCDKIRTKGFSYLHQLMNAYLRTETTVCGKYNCDGITDSKRLMGHHMFIETDSLSSTYKKFTCPLGDVPLDLHLAGDEFVLQAVIHFTSFHYVTYVRRPSGMWEIHNDMDSIIRVVKELKNEKVCPHAVIYIKIKE